MEMTMEDELLKEIAGYLHGYLKSGQVKINSFLSKINVNISNLEQLMIIRFLLKPETKDFVKELPNLMRRFKTTTAMNHEQTIGEIRGQIDWEQTIKDRIATNYLDKTRFSTTENKRTYHSPENLMLKELLALLYQVLFKDDYINGFEKAKWFQEWQGLKKNVAYFYKKNIYLQRVGLVPVTNRTIINNFNHRNQLYRDAARLLWSYRQLIQGNYSEQDIKELLSETFIAPDNKDVLFELYWVVQIMKQNTVESQLHIMDGSNSMVASWDTNEHIYHLYHDSKGSRNIQFQIPINEITNSDHPYLNQKEKSFLTTQDAVAKLFSKNQSNFFWQGRPDILLEVYEKDSGKLVKLMIGEVKNTSSVQYAITGLKELIDYLYYVKTNKQEYLSNKNVDIQGILCLGDVPFNQKIELENIKVVKRGIPIKL